MSPSNHGAIHGKRALVGLAGNIGSGKTTAALTLTKIGFTRIRFAGPLKQMMRVIGLTEAQIEGAEKEIPCELLCGKTPRWAMQSIGTEWGRYLIGPEFWINVWKLHVAKQPLYVPIVCDDVRFENEAKAIRDMGGIVIKIVRTGHEGITHTGNRTVVHASEQLNFPVDHVIHNDGSLDEFCERVRRGGLDFTQTTNKAA